MTKSTVRQALIGAALVLFAVPAIAQPPCPAGTILGSSVVLVDAAPAIPNSITIRPDGSGQTLASRGLTIEVCITCSGAPLVGLPAAAITLAAPGLYVCSGGLGAIADAPTDAAGCTAFTGTIDGGGCSPALTVVAAGTPLGAVAVAVRSPDGPGVSPGYIDAGDLAYFAASLPSAIGSPTFNACVDFNADGFVDASDVAAFAAALGLYGTFCP